MDTLLQDVRYGLRMLARNRGFTIVAVLTLAVGVGATTAIFSFVNAVLIRPLSFPESQRLALVGPPPSPTFPIPAVSQGDFVEWQLQNRTFDGMTAFAGTTFSVTGGGSPERVWGANVTSGFFRTLGVSAVRGRTFSADDERTNLLEMAVISERLWRRRFTADPAIVGKPLTLDGKPYTIAGVVAADFTFPLDLFRFAGSRAWPPPEIWVAFAPEPGYRSNVWHQVVGRVKRGVTLEQAEADVTAIAHRVNQQVPANRRLDAVRLRPLQEHIVGDVRPLLAVFLGAVGFVLLIACVNVANLLLARASARRREVAVRAALGSSRWRLVRQFVTESLLLGLLGGAGGVLAAVWGVDAATALLPAGSLPRIQEIRFDAYALLFALGVSLASGVLFGLAPALHSAGANIVPSLKEGDNAEKPRLRILDLLVVSEVALAFVLLVGAALMVRSFLRLTGVDPGFSPERTLAVSVTLPERAYETPAQMAAFARDVVERLADARGVTHVGAINWLPLGGSMLTGSFLIDGPPRRGLWASKPAVTPDYFRAMGIPLVRGRPFSERDTADAPGVAIVTERLARGTWPGRDAIGQRLKLGFGRPESQPWLTVVGIVRDVRAAELAAEPLPAIYVPVGQAPRPFLLRSLTFVARTTGDPLGVAAAARTAINRIDPSLPIDRIETMDRIVAGSVSEPRFRTAVFAAFASAALVLVATGILGVLAYAVARRTREIGVRIALGAQRAHVLGLVVRHALTMTLAGVALGAAGAVGLTRVLRRYLYEIAPGDPVALAAAALVLLIVAAVAIYLPARRATIVDPMIALRAE